MWLGSAVALQKASRGGAAGRRGQGRAQEAAQAAAPRWESEKEMGVYLGRYRVGVETPAYTVLESSARGYEVRGECWRRSRVGGRGTRGQRDCQRG